MTPQIDIKWLEAALIDKGYDIVKLLSLDVKPALSAGENYVSRIYRLYMTALGKDGMEQTLTVILKYKIEITLPIENMTESLEDIFIKEYDIYVHTLGKFRKYLPKGKTQLWANCLGKKSNKEIYFEDLKASGYSVSDRLNGLDFDHCQIVFKTLAEFHAASYLAIENGEFDPTPFKKYLALGSATAEHKLKTNEFEIMSDVIQKDWGPEWSDLVVRLNKYKDTLVDMAFNLGKNDGDRINVFCHGDTWVNNFMFKYDLNGKPESLKFVDFQIVHYHSFAFDLAYLINTSIDYELRKIHLDSWIKTYCETFSTCLDQHGSNLPRPTPQIVNEELIRLAPFSLLTALRIRPVIMVPSEYSMPISELFQNNSGIDPKKRRLYTTPNYMKLMKSDLPEILSVMESNNKV